MSATAITLTAVGDTALVTTTVRDQQGQAMATSITWATSAAAVAAVSSGGVVTAIGNGSATITATAGSVSGTVAVTVRQSAAAVELSPATIHLPAIGATAAVTAIARDANGAAIEDLPLIWTWESSAAEVATVATDGIITAVGNGTATITATAGSASGTVPVTVEQTVATIILSPDSIRLASVGATAPLTAVVRDAADNQIDDVPVTWITSAPTVATVSSSGVVTAVGFGTATITAAAGSASATAEVSVSAVASLEISASAPEGYEGESVQLSAILKDAAGQTVGGVPVTWMSDSAHIATVDASGLVRALKPGVARLRVTGGGLADTLHLPVRGLLHRWTFSEEGGPGTIFRDDVGGAQATLVRVGTLAGSAVAGQVTLTGGARAQADYVALPARILRHKTDATIEVWATLHSLKSWSRILDVGASPGNNIFLAWSQATSPLTDRAAFTVNGVEHRLDRVLAPFSIDVQHHIVLSIDEGGGGGGQTRLTFYLDGILRGTFETPYRLRDLVDDNFWLGRSHYNDETANASYDEVRLHDRVYAPAEIQQFYLRGPIRSGSVSSLSILRPAGMQDTVRGLNVRFPLRLIGRDQLGRQFPAAGARWASSHPDIATVDSTGAIHTLAIGRTEISATLGAATTRWTAEVVRMRRIAIDPYLATPAAGALWEVPVVLIAYLPTADGTTVDTLKNPGFYAADPMTLDLVEQRVLDYAKRKKMSLEEGSRFRGYKDPAAMPSLGFRIVEHMVVYELVAPSPTRFRADYGDPRLPDWFQVFADWQLDSLIRNRHVKQIWFAASPFDAFFPSYNPAIHREEDFRFYFESDMASPTTGDISNSFRDPGDLPILPHTYIVYGINYRRSQAEAVHNVGHQLEAMMSYAAQRQDGNVQLFWRDFVGQDVAGQFITGRAGWTHMPPNTTGNYDYLNSALRPSDIEDWRPDNAGQKKPVNVSTWGNLVYPWPGLADFSQRVETQWYTYWFQNFPGRDNRIPHGSRWMTNWWAFVGDWDAAITSGLGLHASTQAAVHGSGISYLYAAPPATANLYVEHPRRP